jgi:hypothetical protein
LIISSDPGLHPVAEHYPPHQEGVRLYCLCKTTDENNMIGCDRCEEWYHFNCVGIDQVSSLIVIIIIFRLLLLISKPMSSYALCARRRRLRARATRARHLLPPRSLLPFNLMHN